MGIIGEGYEFDPRDFAGNGSAQKANGGSGASTQTGSSLKDAFARKTGQSVDPQAGVYVKDKGSDSIRHIDPDEKVDMNNVDGFGFTAAFNTA